MKSKLVKLGIVLVWIVWLAAWMITLAGCSTVEPDTLTIDSSHVSHHYGSGPYDYGADTLGVGEHWQRGPVSVDVAEYARHDKPFGPGAIDTWEPELSASAHYTFKLKGN